MTRDIHCVTKGSKFDTSWTGVSVDELLEGMESAAEYVQVFSDDGVVVRCPSCEQVLMKIVRGKGRIWLDLTGIRCLEIDSSA